jgi:hypothetical protein
MFTFRKRNKQAYLPWAAPRLVRGLFDSKVKVTQVSAGRDHTAAVTTAGELYIWGDNSLGALGNPNKVVDQHPRLVLPDTQRGLAHQCVEFVACGGWHTLAFTSGSILGRDLYRVYQDTCTSSDRSDYADMVLVVGGRIIYAHKLILARRSPKFKELIFKEEMSGRFLEILLPDLRYEVALKMIEYIYSDNLYGQIVSSYFCFYIR